MAVIRGVPLVVQLLIMAFVDGGFEQNHGLLYCNRTELCGLCMSKVKYVAVSIRSGNRMEMEAGRSLKLNTATTIFFIILPQAFKSALPALCNEVLQY